jgi:hypothetical protein
MLDKDDDIMKVCLTTGTREGGRNEGAKNEAAMVALPKAERASLD